MDEMKNREYLLGRQYADSSRLSTRARLHEYNTNPYPFDAASFDAVVANHMLYHVLDCMQALSPRELMRFSHPRRLGRLLSG